MNTPTNCANLPYAKSLSHPYALVTADKAGVVLIEPTERTASNTSSLAIAARYCKLTGFPADCVFIDKDGSDYTARVAIGRISAPPAGTGQFIGQCGYVFGKGIVTDTFRIEALENKEFRYSQF